MPESAADVQREDRLVIHVVSGGVGASGELLAHTVLAQFPGAPVDIVVHSHVHDVQDVNNTVDSVAKSGGMLLHTLVNGQVRDALLLAAHRLGVEEIDLAGPVIEVLSARLGSEPVGQPGLYRKLYDQYFKRIDAIEFTIDHDDGKRTHDLAEADIILMGVSRLGKTPLSVYLAMQGWRVANVPFVPGIKLPDELWSLDRRRVVGLTIEPTQLAVHRRWREQRLGVPVGGYVDQKQVAGELREANRFFHSHNIPVVDVTDKPIETSGSDIVGVVTRRLHSLPPQQLSSKK